MRSSSEPRVFVSMRATGRIVGALFLSAFLLYGGGNYLDFSSTGSATAVPENASSTGLLCAGAALLLLNSVAVAAIGALAFRVLRGEHPRTAYVYLATRTAEAVLLALAPLGTLTLALFASGRVETADTTSAAPFGVARTLAESGDSAYLVAMTTLGVGSIFFCWTLLRSRLLPRFLAAWGVAGYAIFTLGSVLELSGYGLGLALSVPGGLFEVAAGLYLLVKGFRCLTPDGSASSSPHAADDSRPNHSRRRKEVGSPRVVPVPVSSPSGVAQPRVDPVSRG